jgi:hypothetical protein
VVVPLAEVFIPSVRVRIELDEGQRSVDRRGRPELGKRDRMVAAQDYRDDTGSVNLFQALPYLLVALLDVAGDDGNVAVVDDREVVEDLDVLGGVEGPEEMRDASYPFGTEAGPGAERSAGVEGSADDGGVGVLEVLECSAGA